MVVVVMEQIPLVVMVALVLLVFLVVVLEVVEYLPIKEPAEVVEFSGVVPQHQLVALIEYSQQLM